MKIHTGKRYVVRDNLNEEFRDNYGTTENLMDATFYKDRDILNGINDWEEIISVTQAVYTVNEDTNHSNITWIQG